MAWLGFGLLGAFVAIVSAGVWWVAVLGGTITAASIVLQYIDAKPFDRVIPAADFVQVSATEWRYQETSWRANGRVSVNVYEEQPDGTWVEVMTDTGIGPKQRFWLGLAVPAAYRVIAR